MNLDDYVNDTVTLFGIAENRPAGAVLLCGARLYVYIEDLRQWSDSELHEAFEVTGTLVAEGSDDDLRGAGNQHGFGKRYVVKHGTREQIT
jgi:hypothetical protein